jgi:alpha-tubulin suppressor-like RCC1 family protein
MESLREAMHAEAAGVPLLGDLDRAIHDVSVARHRWAGAVGVTVAVLVLLVALVGPGWQPLAVQPAAPQPSPTPAPQRGAVIAWGSNENGQTSVPSDAKSGVTAVAAGRWHAMALKGGQVITWGGGRMADLRTNVPVEAQSGVTAIAAGGNHSLALRDGRVIAWGGNGNGQSSVPVEAQSGVTAIAASSSVSLALHG